MGSLPALAILKGLVKPLSTGNEPLLLPRIFENTLRILESNNNDEKELNIHNINLSGITATDPALIFGNTRTTFSELNENANKLARAMLSHVRHHGKKEVSPNPDGDFVVAVNFHPSDALVTTLLAIWKMGASYLPLDPTFPVNRIQHILNEAEPMLIVSDSKDASLYGGADFMTYQNLHKVSAKLSGENLSQEETLSKDTPPTRAIATILFTSGSTGTPKGVRIPHSAIVNRLKWQYRAFPFSQAEKLCVFKTTLTFVDSIQEIWGALLAGRGIVIVPKDDTKNPERLVPILEKHNIKRLVLVPTLLNAILMYIDVSEPSEKPGEKKPTNRLSNLRLWICSGETLTKELAMKFLDTFDCINHILCNFYGSTEVMADVTAWVIPNKHDLAKMEKVAIGTPVDNTNVYLLNHELQPVKADEVGELFVSGLNLAAGYVKNRDPHKFIDNPLTVDPNHLKLYRTGDYAKVMRDPGDAHYVLFYEGRTDSQIKVRGHRVDLSEIEAALGKMKTLDRFAVLAYKPGMVNQALLAFVSTLKPDLTEKDIERHLSFNLPPYMAPRVIVVEKMPLLVNGKIDRQQLLQTYESETSGAAATAIANMNYTEIRGDLMPKAKALFETIAQCLGGNLKGKITPSSNFYQLGGNSINSVYTVTKLRDVGYHIGIEEFINAATLLDVVNHMREEKPGVEPQPYFKVPEGKYKAEVLSCNHKEAVYECISRSFQEKADLERYLDPKITVEEYYEVMDHFWPVAVEKGLSFVARGMDGQIKGVTLNYDLRDTPYFSFSHENKLHIIFEFLEFVEIRFSENGYWDDDINGMRHFPEEIGKTLHVTMMGVNVDTPAHEAIGLFAFMEDEVLKMAKKKGYDFVFSTNTSTLTQQLAADVNNYKTLLVYHINQYVAPNGTKPFGKAPDDQKIFVSCKYIGD